MAPNIIEVRNHTRRQIVVVSFPASVKAPRLRLRRLHAKDTPGWDYEADHIQFRTIGAVAATETLPIFLASYAKARKMPGWRVLTAVSLHRRST